MRISKFPGTAGEFIPILFICFASLVYASPKNAGNANPKNVDSGKIREVANEDHLSKAVVLDSALVRKYYMDGDFDPAIEMLEKGLKEKRHFNHNDSVFIYKHLGVMYAARYETREKGKYYMHQLLMTEPTAKIMDMYASDMIYMIFKNIQEEFESNRMRLSQAEENVKGNAQTEPKNTDPSKSKNEPGNSKGHTAVWVGATAAAVAVGVGAYFLLSSPSKTTTDNHKF